MTLEKLIEELKKQCNEETKNLNVYYYSEGTYLKVVDIWRHKIKNDYITEDEIRIA